MRLLDIDLRRAEAVATEHGGGKAQARQADATKDLAEQLAGMEVLVNSAAYRINLAAMSACLDVGCHYMDLGGLYHVTAEQLELSREFEQRGRLPCWASGRRPGKTNLLAARAVRELAGKPISISVARRRPRPRPARGAELPVRRADAARRDHDGADGADQRPAAGDASRCRTGPARTSATRSAWPRRSSPSTRRSSRSAIPSGAERDLRALAVTEGAREPQGAVGGERGADCRSCPLRFAPFSEHALHPHRRGRPGRTTVIRARSVTPPNEAWGLGGGIVSTASPAAAAVRLLARGSITKRGALPPESCIDPDEMFAELETRGVRFDVSSSPLGKAQALSTRTG